MNLPHTGTIWCLEVHETLLSTSDYLIDHARAGAPDGLAVLARRQSAGRGQAGRAWDAPAGNLSFSVLLRPRAGQSGHWALLAAVALHETLAAFLADPAALRLKWPNDLLLAGRKLAGILVDAEASEGSVPAWLVIGFGANLCAAPTLADRPTACLADAMPQGGVPDALAVAHALCAVLARWRDVLERDGPSPILAAWRAAGPDLGTHLWVRAGAAEPLGGAFAGLAADGALLLEQDGACRAIHAGEVLQAG